MCQILVDGKVSRSDQLLSQNHRSSFVCSTMQNMVYIGVIVLERFPAFEVCGDKKPKAHGIGDSEGIGSLSLSPVHLPRLSKDCRHVAQHFPWCSWILFFQDCNKLFIRLLADGGAQLDLRTWDLTRSLGSCWIIEGFLN